MVKIVNAISYAHSRGVLHRDIKPSNILFDEHDEPLVADFGLAKLEGKNSGMTMTGTVLGTPAYMSPEQAAGNFLEVSTVSDVYSLGVIFYELLTGVVPFQAETPLEMLKSVTEDIPNSPTNITKKIPEDLSTITLKCLEKDPQRRYQSAELLLEDLERFLDGRPVRARRPSVFYIISRYLRRHTLATVTLVLTVLSLLGGTSISTWLYFQQKKALAHANSESAFRSEIVGFLTDALSAAGSSQNHDSTMMLEVLEKTVKRLDQNETNPFVEAELRTIIGKAYFDLAELRDATLNLERSLELRRSLKKEDPALLCQALNDVAAVLLQSDRIQEGSKLVQESIKRNKSLKSSSHQEKLLNQALMLKAQVK